MTSEMVQADASAPALSEKVNNPYRYTHKDMSSRLVGIRSTVAFVIKQTDLQDYDDEMANDLRLAVIFLEQLLSNDERKPEDPCSAVSLNQSLHHTQSKEG